jgi:hypothetical protein
MYRYRRRFGSLDLELVNQLLENMGWIRDPEQKLIPDAGPGIKRAPDPESGSFISSTTKNIR